MEWPVKVRCPKCGREWNELIEIDYHGTGRKLVTCYDPNDPEVIAIHREGCGHLFAVLVILDTHVAIYELKEVGEE